MRYGTDRISNTEDMLDSRDIIARIEYLQGVRDDAEADETRETVGLDADEEEELAALEALASECEGYVSDWQHGEVLIRDTHFREYAEQWAEDCGLIERGASWPNNCIDWDEAAEELKQDYTSVDFAGREYLVRA